jgi:RNA 2',3'-cyclic 3'-phosphodiesterase
MRLFVALAVPDHLRGTLASLVDRLRRVDALPRWVSPENLHVTLKFVGEVPSGRLSAIGQALAPVRFPHPFDLEFCGVGFFPNARRPGVAWIGIESSPNLGSLASEVNRALAPLGMPPDERPFVAHLTIARCKQTPVSGELLSEIEKWQGHRFGGFTTGQFQLIESRLKTSGAEYTTLRSFTFASEGKCS